MEDKTFELLEKMYSEFIDFKNEMTDFKENMTDFKNNTESRLSKIELSQEKMSSDIRIIAEVQANHMEQNERQHKDIMDTIDKKIGLTEEAIKHLAGETTMNTAELSFMRKRMR